MISQSGGSEVGIVLSYILFRPAVCSVKNKQFDEHYENHHEVDHQDNQVCRFHIINIYLTIYN